MSRAARLALVLGCLGVSALHLPRAAHAARAGLFGPYRGASAGERERVTAGAARGEADDAGDAGDAGEVVRLARDSAARAPLPGEGM